jgi:rubrerythrin
MAWSIVNFSGEEIIKLAVEIEKAGKIFYQKALTRVDDHDAKTTFISLAEEEAGHISDFQKLGEALTGNVTPEESYPGEYGDYLKSIIDTHVFNRNNVEDLVKDIKTFREALAIAFSFEKDSIMIFQEFGKVVDENGKKVIAELIRQEKEHIKKLTQLYRRP